MTTRELLKARYTRIRANLVADDGIVEHIPPVDEVTEAQWAADEAYLAEQRKGRSFTFSRIDRAGETHEAVTIGTVEYWTEVLREDASEVRAATEAEIVDFVMGGGIEEDEADEAAFQRGWNAYSEGW